MSTQCPWVQQYPPTSRTCLLFTHLGFACLCLPTGIPDPLLFSSFAWLSCWVKAETVAVRSAIVFHWDIMFSLSAAAAVSRLIRASCVPSISLRLFAPWYPPAQVDTLWFLLNFRCAAWKCVWKFAQVFCRVSCRLICRSCHQTGPCCITACIWCQRYLRRRSSVLNRSQTLVFPGHVAPIIGKVGLRPMTPITLSDLPRGLGTPSVHTL